MEFLQSLALTFSAFTHVSTCIAGPLSGWRLMSQLSVSATTMWGKPFSLEAMLPLIGHHETPLSASTKMLGALPQQPAQTPGESVIPADSEKKSFEKVSGDMDSWSPGPESEAGQ